MHPNSPSKQPVGAIRISEEVSAEEIQLFNNSIAYHQPVAIGSFLIFSLIYRSKFYSHKKLLGLNKESSNDKVKTIAIEES